MCGFFAVCFKTSINEIQIVTIVKHNVNSEFVLLARNGFENAAIFKRITDVAEKGTTSAVKNTRRVSLFVCEIIRRPNSRKAVPLTHSKK